MPLAEMGNAQSVVRRAKTIRGEVRYRMVCDPRFDYGRARHRVQKKKQEVLFISQGEDKTVLRLRSEVQLKEENAAATAEVTLLAGGLAAYGLSMGRHSWHT